MLGLLAAEQNDLVRFVNSDQLHGTFLGIKKGPQAVWQRDDLSAPVEFKTTRIRHIVLNGGRARTPLGTLCHLGLVNGDRVPGTIIAMDADTITLDTTYAGVLRVPRKQVSLVAPNPFGGRLYYHGPFVADEWEMRNASFPDGIPDVADDADPDADAEEEDDADADAKEKSKDQPGRWEFAGSAWYWHDKRAGTAIIRKDGMPDRAVLRFDVAWKNRLSFAIGFHADFVKPKAKEDDDDKGGRRGFVPGDSSYLPSLFGNSYVLQLYSTYLMLYRTSVDEDGKTGVERVQLNTSNFRLGESGRATVELRSNRKSGSIALFVNDDFVAQWSEKNPLEDEQGEFAGKGNGFGFVVQADSSPVRISDIVVSEWNGMPDSARSLQVDSQDIVLMANGTDRYSGKVGMLNEEGKLLFEGKHGRFEFPLDDVAEIRFARDQLAEAADEPVDNFVVRLGPIGTISGLPVSGDKSVIEILSPVMGPVSLSLDSAIMLDFNSTNQIIDDWDEDF